VRAWSHSHLTFPLGRKQRYPLSKYALLRERVQALGIAVAEPEAIPWGAVERAHDPHFVARMRRGSLTPREERVIGLPWSPELIQRSLHGIQGTLEAARDALTRDHATGVMLGGGTHHAGHATARGFCVFNDLAIVTHELRRAGAARRILVVDCDVHQGDGTAELLGPDPDAFTVSLQGARNYPFTRIPSDLDVELATGTTDGDYLDALDEALTEAAQRFPDPDLVFYVAGADPWEGDALGRLALTKDGLRRRDERVLGLPFPTVVTLAGGYAPDVTDTVDIHAATIEAAAARAALTRSAAAPRPS
jgi:acetoin utilization deacetylase AcuC-like enzyme